VSATVLGLVGSITCVSLFSWAGIVGGRWGVGVWIVVLSGGGAQVQSHLQAPLKNKPK